MKQYTPLASKSFGIDSETGLEKKIITKLVIIDAENERLEILFDCVLVSPLGPIVSVLESSRYIRDNSGSNPKYDQQHDSALGAGIMAMLQVDLDNIQSYSTRNDDLLQTDLAVISDESDN